MFKRISYPRRGAALVLYVLAVATLGTAIVAALSPIVAVLISAALALLFISDLLTLRKAGDDIKPKALLVAPPIALTPVELEAFAAKLTTAVTAMNADAPTTYIARHDGEPVDDYVSVELSFECSNGERAADIVADLNAGDPTGLQRIGYAVDRATWHGAELDWEGRA